MSLAFVKREGIGRASGTAFMLLVLLGCAGMKKPSEVRGNPSMDRRMQEALDTAVAEFKVPGAILALRGMDGTTRIWTSGMADRESGTPMIKDLYFRIGSVTKSYTSTTVLQLADEGRVRLDDPIGKYLPGLVPRENEITLLPTVRHRLDEFR